MARNKSLFGAVTDICTGNVASKRMHLATLMLAWLVGMVLLTSCGDTGKTGQKESARFEPIESKNTVLSRDSVSINCSSVGEGHYTVLFVHGWCIDQTFWSAQVETLSQDYRVVTLDLPGFGASGKNRTDWSIENYGADVNAVIEQLNLTRVILVGHSMGGDVVLEAALNNKNVVALIGIDNFKEVGVQYDEQTKAEISSFIELVKSSFSEVVPAYAEQALFHASTDSLVRTRVLYSFLKSDSVIAASSLEGLFNYVTVESDRLATLEQKIFLINSDATPTNISGLDNSGIDYELLPIEATGHYPMIEKPERFNELLRQAIQKIEKEQD